MKKIICLMFVSSMTYAAAPNSGTIIFYQNSGQELGTTNNATPGNSSLGFLMSAHGPATYKLNVDSFSPVGVTLTDSVNTANESQVQIPFHTAGTISGLWVMVSANSLTANTTVYMRINGARATEAVVIQASTIGEFQDTTHSDSVHVNDKLDYEVAAATAGTSLSINGIATLFQPITGNMIKFVGSNDFQPNQTSVNGFATYYNPPAGFVNLNDLTELNEQYRMKTAGTFSNFAIYVTTNTRNQGATTLNFRKNGANGNETISIPQGGTGLFEDTTHTDSVVVGDTVAYQLVMDGGNGAGVFGVTWEGSEFTTTGKSMEYPASTSGHSFQPGDANIMPIQGALGFDSAEINDYQVLSQVAGTISNMHVYLQSNNLTQPVTLIMRKNQANCFSMTLPAGTTGYFEDTTDTCSIAVGDKIDYKDTVPAGTGQAPLNYVGAVFTHN